MHQNKAFNSSIETLVKKYEEASSHCNAIKASDPNKQTEYKQLLNQISDLRGRANMYPYLGSGFGQGPFVELLDGSIKLDFICGIGPHILGHGHPELVRASLQGALEDTVMQGHLQMSDIYRKTLEKLIQIASRKSKLKYAWLAPSGSMANENALKSVRQKRNSARYILAFDNAFAGRTTMMAEITANPKIREGLPSYNEVLRVPFTPDDPGAALKVLEKHWQDKKEDLACFIMELIPGDGGCLSAPRDFFVTLCKFCKEKGIPIWFDEVQTFARSGEFFAFEKLDLGEFVDVCTIGKCLQNSATLWTEELNPKPGLVSGTFSGSSASLHSAYAVLNILDQGYMGSDGRIMKIHQAWLKRLQQLEKESLVSNISGSGIMMGATALDGDPKKVSKILSKSFEKGLICFSCGDDSNKRLRFLMPAILEDKHLDLAYSILKESLLEVQNQ